MSKRYRLHTASLLELTTPQITTLIHKSQTQPRRNKKQYMKDLGGAGDARELDEAFAIARCNQEAVKQAEVLRSDWERKRNDDARSVSRDVSQAVSFFVNSLIAGDFGPDDSRDGRSDAFLKDPHTVARATELFHELAHEISMWSWPPGVCPDEVAAESVEELWMKESKF